MQLPNLRWFVSILLLSLCTAAASADVIHHVTQHPFLRFEADKDNQPTETHAAMYGDRFVYDADDRHGQFYVVPDLPEGQTLEGKSLRIAVSLKDNGKAVHEETIDALEHPKFHFLIDVRKLKAGSYVVTAVLQDGEKAIGEARTFSFTKTDDSRGAAAFPKDGLPVTLYEQDALKYAKYPTRVSVPLPVNAIESPNELTLLEDGKPIASTIHQRGSWGPLGSAKWLHVHFTGKYRDGKPAEYRLVCDKQQTKSSVSLRVDETDSRITVDTGYVRFEIAKTAYAGIDAAWFDGTGERQYNVTNKVIDAPGGPYVLDGRGILFDSKSSADTKVVIESQSDQRIVIRATGWYSSAEGRVPNTCQFSTRYIVTAGSPMIDVQHHTILAYDTRDYRLADVGFHFAVPTAKQYALGIDGETTTNKLPERGDTFLHQDRYDHVRLIEADKPIKEGRHADGWASIRSDVENAPTMAVFMRDIWQRFPKEIGVSRNGLSLHFWPKHGHRAFDLQNELALGEIHKYWTFHQHRLLDLNLPAEYFAKLQEYPGTFECTPEHGLAGNGQGLAIGTDFALMFFDPMDSDLAPRWAKLYQQDPIAHTPAKWNADTGAMGNIAAADDPNYQWVEEANENAFLSYTRSVERGNNYGMWNYADTHTYWDVPNDRPELHRVWHNSHYHEVGKTWLLYFRSGSRRLLDWARASTDHYINVDTINYHDPDKPLKWHRTGAMYHCKAPTHWGSDAYGMQRRNSHAGLWGHWVDPDASAWSWLIDADPRAGDVYRQWHEACRFWGVPHRGTAREINTSLAIICELYRNTWDADFLPAIHGMGLSLRTEKPLEEQNPGPMWHPLWINRYVDLTRDARYEPFIYEHGVKEGIKDTWVVALGALAYEWSKDPKYLQLHFNRLTEMPRKFYRHEGDPYDWYGWGPGPLGSRWFWMGWPNYLKQLQAAGIEKVKRTSPPRGSYPYTPSDVRFPDNRPPSMVVYALEPKDQDVRLAFAASSLGGDLHRQMLRVYDPEGSLVHELSFPQAGRSSNVVEEAFTKDGKTGVWRILLWGYEANVSGPLTDLPYEAAAAQPKRTYRLKRMYAYALPMPSDREVTVTLSSETTRSPAHAILQDASGKALIDQSIFAARPKKEASIKLSPDANPQPYLIDLIGKSGVTFEGDIGYILIAPTAEAIEQMKPHLQKAMK